MNFRAHALTAQLSVTPLMVKPMRKSPPESPLTVSEVETHRIAAMKNSICEAAPNSPESPLRVSG